MVTLDSLDAQLQPLARKVIDTVRSSSSRIVENPTKSYLGLKYGRYLVCAIYPSIHYSQRCLYLGHWDPPEGGLGSRWLKPVISREIDLGDYLEKIRSRVQFLETKDPGKTLDLPVHRSSRRIPRYITVSGRTDMESGSYEIRELIGEGGMGCVFRAIDTMDHSRMVAVKFLGRARRATAEETARFRREVRIHESRLRHDNIISFISSRLDTEWPYFVMEFAHKGNLRTRLMAEPIEMSVALGIFDAVCGGVVYAHSSGVIHRDLKPENILQVSDGVWKVSDFGLCVEVDRQTASLTQTRMALGTFHYCAPEQLADAKRVDHRADIYSLGVILFELLTGNYPPVRTTEVPEAYRAIIDKATERDPSARFQTVKDLRDALPSAGT